jgi:hypothetical protein
LDFYFLVCGILQSGERVAPFNWRLPEVLQCSPAAVFAGAYPKLYRVHSAHSGKTRQDHLGRRLGQSGQDGILHKEPFDLWNGSSSTESRISSVSIVAELRLEPNILELIPIGSSPNPDNKYPVLVPPEKWRDMLTRCLRSREPEVQYAIAASARHLVLKELGWTDFDANDPRKIQRQQIIDDAPDFIKHSELEDDDKVYIADAYVPGVDDVLVMKAKRIAVERLENIKKVLQHGKPDQLSQLGPILQMSVERILNDSLREAVDADQKRSRDQVKTSERKKVEDLLSQPQELADAIRNKLASTSLKEWQINNRPALDVLLSRICALPRPELKLLAAHLIDHRELSLKVWFDSMRDEHEVKRAEKEGTLTD